MPRHYAIDGCDVGRLLATWHMAKPVRPASGAERLAGAVSHATTRLTDAMWAGCWQRGIWLNRRGEYVRPASGAERLAGAACHATTRLTNVMWVGY
ncbi:hypothetical protein ACQKDS_10200 [Serratia sp. NPDC078593]|uniref:hypothetical protein n=1 Tax=unclassified Serratia (in: enterobacteria) TaxID=2647522 RepID=UPI0037CFD359